MRASHCFAAVFVGLMVVLTGCQAVGPDADSAGSMAPHRPNEADQQRIAEALAGLIFDDSGVSLDPATAGRSGWATDAQLQGLLDTAEESLRHGRAIRAIGEFADAVIAAPDRAEPYEGLGRSLIREGKSPEALASFRQAVSISPDWHAARIEIGNTLQRLGRHDDAIDAWQELVQRDPENGNAHANLASTYQLRGLTDLAAAHLALAQEFGGNVPAQLPGMIATGHEPHATVNKGYDAGDDPRGAAVTIGPKTQINTTTVGGSSDETSCVAVDATPGQAIAAWNAGASGYKVGAAVTLDGGETWTDFMLNPSNSYCDGMTAADPRTGAMWVGGLTGSLGMFVMRSQLGTTNFDPPTIAGNADKPWMVAGRRPDDPESTRMYITANINFAYSDDFGQTWIRPGSGAMSGIGHLPRIGPDGELYFSYWDLGNGVMLQRSFDGGATLETPIRIATRRTYWDIYASPEVPGGFRVPPLSYLAVDADTGTLYCVYFDVTDNDGVNDNVDLYMTRSTDQGTTWATPWVINGDTDPPGDQFFPWVEVDSSGRLHVLFFDTRHTAQNDSAGSAYIDAYYAWSEDGGETWTEHRLTDTTFNTGGASSFLGDYLGMGVGADRAYPIYPYVNGSVHEIATNMIVWQTSVFEDDFEDGDTSKWWRVAE